MKKQYTFLVLGLCAGLLVAACSDDDYTNDFTRPAGGNQIFFNCQSQLDENNKVIWAADSKIGFFCEQTETVNLAVGLAAPSVGQTEGLFYTQVVWNKEAGDHTFYVYAPYDKGNTSAKAIAGTLSNSQLQSGITNTHLTNSALTYATATSAEVETAVPMTFKHALGYLDIHCKTAAKYAGWKVKSIELSTEDGISLAGEYKFDLTTGQFTIANGSSKVQVKVDNAPELVLNEAFHGYMSVNPLDLSSKQCKVTIVIEKEGEDSDLSLAGNLASIKILAGEFNTLEVDMDALTATKLGDTSIDLSANETANCYIAGRAGQEYRFNATVMGNGAITPETANYDSNLGTAKGITPSPLAPKSASILWQSEKSLLSGVKLKNNYIYFTLNGSDNTPLVSGNAVIAAYDDAGTIVWSWHIWVTDADLDSKVETYTIHSDFNSYDKLINPMMMDRNLGALSATCWSAGNENNNAQGMRYQWGRKDPFPERDNSAMASTSFMTTYDKENNMISAFAAFTEGNNSSWSYTGTPIELTDIAKYPMCYIGAGAENWLKDGGNDLWGNPALTSKDAPVNDTGHKTIYDPCPPGYRVPHAYVWTGFVSVPEGGKYSTNAVTVNVASGTMTDLINNGGGAFSVGSTPVYPNTGYLNNASSGPIIKNPANRGQSWSNGIITAKNGSSLMYDTANFFPLRSQAKTYGYPVRCMKDTK